jgi:hypothetical protein
MYILPVSITHFRQNVTYSPFALSASDSVRLHLPLDMNTRDRTGITTKVRMWKSATSVSAPMEHQSNVNGRSLFAPDLVVEAVTSVTHLKAGARYSLK